jgi:D-alanyl-D-alanine carboxypeptidase
MGWRRWMVVLVAMMIASGTAAGCSGDDDSGDGADAGGPTTTAAPDRQAQDLAQGLVDDLVARSPTIPGAVVHVVGPDLDLGAAAGVADTATGEGLTPDATFRIASNTKTYTAAATLRLVEQGEIDLDGPVGPLISDESRAALQADGYDTDAITVRRLLLHTAGLYDFGTDAAYQGAILADMSHRWTRIEQVRWATDHGDPLGAPGEFFAYSDTGYVLLGEIVERASGDDLPTAYRSLLDVDDRGLDATWFETLEDVPEAAGPRAHQYFADIDAYGADPSFDLYGGGGLDASAADLARFYRALLAGDVFDDPATLDTMLEIPPVSASEGVAMGLYEIDIAGESCWYHRGFWGTFAVACPDADLAAAVSVGQAVLDDPDGPLDSLTCLLGALGAGA